MTNNEALWHWCLQVYEREGVPALCLQAQDEYGADVCLLLCALWLEQRGATPQPGRRMALVACASDWQKRVVKPLRNLRREWKAAAQEDPALARLRQQLQRLEIEAERELLERLQALASHWPVENAGSDWLGGLLPQLPIGLQQGLRRLAQS